MRRGTWSVNQMVTGPASDGGRERISTLKVRDPITKEVIQEVSTNKENGKLFYQNLFSRQTVLPVPVRETPSTS